VTYLCYGLFCSFAGQSGVLDGIGLLLSMTADALHACFLVLYVLADNASLAFLTFRPDLVCHAFQFHKSWHISGVGNHPIVAGQKQTLQGMTGRTNFHQQFHSLSCL